MTSTHLCVNTHSVKKDGFVTDLFNSFSPATAYVRERKMERKLPI